MKTSIFTHIDLLTSQNGANFEDLGPSTKFSSKATIDDSPEPVCISLYPNSIFKISAENKKDKIIWLKWKRFEPFCETSLGISRYGFTISSDDEKIDVFLPNSSTLDGWLYNLQPNMISEGIEQDYVYVDEIVNG